MANWFTKAIDRITPWDRGGERKRREEEALRRAQQPKIVRPTPQPNIQVQRNKTIGGQDFSLGVEPNRQVSVPKTPTVQRQDYDKSAIDKGLDAGRSWEDISRDSGIGLDQVREHSQRTRPEYGIPKRKPNEVTLPVLRDLDTIGGRGTQERRSPTKELSKAAISTLASTGRLSAGLGQATGTAFDYLTPGKGRNRFTEASNRKARELDVIARDHGNDALYKTMNVGGEVLMAAANPAKAVGSVASKTPIISRIGAPVSRALSRLTSKADDAINIGGRTGNIIRGGTRELLDPTNVGNEVILGNKYLANELANTEQPLTPRMVAENAVMGIGGAFAPAILRNLGRGSRNTGRRAVDEAIGGTAFTNRIDDVLSEGDIEDIMRTTDIHVGRPVDVRAPVDKGIEIPVRNLDPEGAIIRELGGDSPRVTNIPTREEIQQVRFRNQDFGAPDPRIDAPGRPVPRAEYTTKAEISAERQALDDALANKEINKTQHKKANQDLNDMEKSLDGRKIEVQEEKTVPVREVTDIPVDDEVGAGSVRPTKVVDRTAEKTEAAARQQASTAVVPPEVQQVLDNPKSYTKAQIARARRQAKLARQYAKAQEGVAEANERIQAASPQARVGQSDRFAPTGVYREGRKGNAYEAANRDAEIELGRKEMSTRSAEDLVDELDGRTGINEGSQRKIEAAIENLKRADPEGKASADLQRVLTQTLVSDRTKIAQMLAIGRRVLRRTATSDALTNRWSAKMARVGDLKNISDADLQSIQRANDNFTTVRDKARAAEEAFKNDPSAANLSAVKKALADEQKANINAIDTELAVSKRVLKGEKGPKAEKVISDLEAEADLHMMDTVTASQLSGPATGSRNLFGTYVAGLENRIGANLRADITSRIKRFDGANVGGFDRASARAGRREGWDKYVSDIQRRSEYSGKNPFKHARNFATSLNQAGESSMHSQIQSRLGAFYKNQLKAQGVSGDELTRRTEFMRLTDPDNMQREFLDQTMKASGLSGIITKGKRVEQGIADMISGGLEQTGLISPKWSKKTARAITRLAVGYPTATGNFIVQSGKRASFGAPSLIEMGVMLKRGNKLAAAQAFDRFLKEAGSGAAMTGLGFTLGSAGLISGAYPDDKDERARWEREGISENSIRIGNTWRPIPQSLGMMGLPIMLGAAVGRDGGEGVQEMFAPKNLTKLLPHDQVQGFMNLASGGGTEAQEKNFVASTIRSGMPLGSLFNQVSKGLDPTKNDTTTRSFWRNVFDQVVTGVPGQHKFADIPDKRSDTGEPITNPGFLDVMTGATTAAQAGGEQRSQEINQNINSQVQSIADLGIFSNEGMREVLDDKTKLVWDKALRGEQIDPSDMKSLNSGLTKGVTTGKGADSDTAYRERGDYETDYAVLNLKKQILEADPTTKPSNLKDLEVQIKRSEILRDNDIPYEMFNLYQNTDLEDWRDLAETNPQLYQQLWELDEMFTKAGGSYGRGDPTTAKYYVKKSGGGSGSGSRSMTAKFYGGLSNTPERKAYAQTALSKGGTDIPVIRRVRPNIVHRIGRG